MPQKRVVLHIGMPKCASTTIQTFLHLNRDLLAANRVYYDPSPEGGSIAQGNAAILRRLLADRDEAAIDAYLDHILTPVAGEGGDVILSSETLLDLARFPHPVPFVTKLAERGVELRILCLMRRQDLWIESDYKQQIKDISPWSGPLRDLISKRRSTRILDYHWVLSRWARFLPPGQITLLPLNQGDARDYVARSLMALIGQSALFAQCQPTEARNISPPVGLIEPARHLKRAALARGLPPEQVSRLVLAFLADAPTRITVPDRRFLMTLSQRRQTTERYAAKNALLAEAFYGGRPVFDDRLDEDPASEIPLADEVPQVLIDYAAGGGVFLPDDAATATGEPAGAGRLARAIRRISG